LEERLNGKIQEIKLSAKVYRQFQNFRTAILVFLGGKIFSHKNNSRAIVVIVRL
jgi:hypothetical protein